MTDRTSIYNSPAQLSAAEYALIRTAFNYQVLPDGALLLSVPSPIGYVYWHSTANTFPDDAEKMLSDNLVKKIEK